MSDAPVQVHPLALCEAEEVGPGTRVFPFAQVMAGAKLGAACHICGHAFLEEGVVLGDRVTVKNGAMLWKGVVVEDDVFVGPGVTFTNDRFPRSNRPGGPASLKSRYADEGWLVETRVRAGASLGARAVVAPGVSVGRFALVGAAALVTRDVADHALVVGHPARRIGWVCLCGERLDLPSELPAGASATCRCGARAREEGGALVVKAGAEERPPAG